MKKLSCLFILYHIFLVLNFSSCCQAENFNFHFSIEDSNNLKYSGIDYYSGRLISGIGFDFNQFLEEKIDGRQEIESTSNFYLSLTKNSSFFLSNQTSIRKISPTDKISFSSDPINSTTQLNAQFRPISGWQFFPAVEFGTSKLIYNSQLVDILSVRQNTVIKSYCLAGMFVSADGFLNAVTPALTWMFYTDENIPFVSPRQALISFQVDFDGDDYEGIFEKVDKSLKPDDENYIMKRQFRTEWNEYSIDSQIYYGISKAIRAGMRTKYNSFLSKLRDDYLYSDNRAKQNNSEYSIEPQLSVILSKNFYQQMNAEFRQFNENSEYQAMFDKKYNQKKSFCDFDYQFHWLTHVNNPSLAKVLADYKQVFGNRLTKGAFHLQLNITRTADFINNKYFKIFETRALLELFHPNLQSRLNQIQLLANYGISDYVQIGLSSSAIIKKSFKPAPGSTDSQWFNRETLINTISFDVANYTFSRRWENIYGWDNLSSLDQYDRPLLLPKMFRGKLECSFHAFSTADEFYSDINIFNSIKNSHDFPFYNNKAADIYSELKFGLWGGIELQSCGWYFNYSSNKRNYLDKDWQVDIYLRLQPFKRLKVELMQNSARFTNNWDSRFSYYLDPLINVYDVDYKFYNKTVHTWNVRIISIF